MSKSITESTYSYGKPLTLRARMHNTGKVRIGQVIEVLNETSDTRYTVILKTDRPSECSCPHYRYRLKGTNRSCRHIDGARASLAQQS